ncbi:MAG TPA: GAF domain-containing protein, partial [Chloroflexi bacterium]|nr:GAF domain-containing protein [Chloroflexota bacterium]
MSTLVSTGIVLLVIGAMVIGAVLISARLTSRRRQLVGNEEPIIPVNLASVNDGVLVARMGGQIIFANEVARRWFALDGGDPDLWSLSQRVDPPEAFLELFAAEGQATLTLDERSIEAASHLVAVGDTTQFVIVLREETALPTLEREERGSPRALQIVSEIAKAINASLELDATLEATLEGVKRLIPYDAAQICLLDQDKEHLRPAARSGPASYVAATRQEGQAYRLDEGYPGWIARQRQPLLIPDVELFEEMPPRRRPTDPPYRSYLGVPLNVRNRFIGTLEVFAGEPGRFDREDLALLSLLSDQAAIAIE